MRLTAAVVVLVALATPVQADDPPLGAVAVPRDAPIPPTLAELRRLPLTRHKLEDGGTVRVNLTSLGKYHLVALVERHGAMSVHFLASGVGTVVAVPFLDLHVGESEVLSPPLGRRPRGDDLLFYVHRSGLDIAVYRIGDELRVAVRDRGGWGVRRAIKLARGTKLITIASTFPH